MTLADKWRRNLIIITRWEFWPWKLIYFPVFLYYLFLCIRARTYVFFTVPNKPYMKHGGIIEESKLEMYLKTPSGFMPKTLPFDPHQKKGWSMWLDENKLKLPLIIKPDHGMRGMGVHLINTIKELENLELKPGFKYIVQEFIAYPKETGILCLKDPNNGKWKISSIMEREFLKVTGNGKNTLEELIRKNYRAFHQLNRWKKEGKFNLNEVLPAGQIKILEKLGNHRLGTRFNDASNRNTKALQNAMAQLCKQLEGFEYGRFDICFESWDKLENLDKFKIIEVNGTNSEPSHIYDPKHTLLYAWKVLFWHWHQVFRIAMYHIKKGSNPLPYSEFKKLYKDYNRLMQY